MNFGERKMQISRAAVPPIRTSRHQRVGETRRRRASSATPREPLTSTVSPGRRRGAQQRRGGPRVGGVDVLAAGEGLAGPGGARADRHEQLDAGRARACSPSSRW